MTWRTARLGTYDVPRIQRTAIDKIATEDPGLLILGPECSLFCSLQGWNHPRMSVPQDWAWASFDFFICTALSCSVTSRTTFLQLPPLVLKPAVLRLFLVQGQQVLIELSVCIHPWCFFVLLAAFLSQHRYRSASTKVN